MLLCAVCTEPIQEDVPDHFKRIGYVRTQTDEHGKWLACADLFSHIECYDKRDVAQRHDTCIFE